MTDQRGPSGQERRPRPGAPAEATTQTEPLVRDRPHDLQEGFFRLVVSSGAKYRPHLRQRRKPALIPHRRHSRYLPYRPAPPQPAQTLTAAFAVFCWTTRFVCPPGLARTAA
jgi:hypothetical protein